VPLVAVPVTVNGMLNGAVAGSSIEKVTVASSQASFTFSSPLCLTVLMVNEDEKKLAASRNTPESNELSPTSAMASLM
jgi:hypothetical protein